MSPNAHRKITYGAALLLTILLFSPYLGFNILGSGSGPSSHPSLGTRSIDLLNTNTSRSNSSEGLNRNEVQPAALREPRRREPPKDPNGKLSEIEALLRSNSDGKN